MKEMKKNMETHIILFQPYLSTHNNNISTFLSGHMSFFRQEETYIKEERKNIPTKQGN